MAKKDKTPDVPDYNGVDMERIKELMGPLPDEGAPAPKNVKKDKKKKDTTLQAAAEEANESIMAMSPDLGNAKIEKITDAEIEEILDAEGRPIEPLGEAPVADASEQAVDPTPESDDPLTAEAVDDIVAHEGDVVLAAEDEKNQSKEDIQKPVKKGRLKVWILAIWAKPATRWTILVGIVLLLLAAALVPQSRYFILNNVGIRASLSIKVLDSGTQLPLKNVQVRAAGVSAQTDEKGEVKLEHVKLGSTDLVIEKRAFAVVTKPIVVGWGSNPLGDFRITAIGTQYSFIVTDFLSGRPIEGAQASSGEGNAAADKDGKITLTLDIAGLADTDELDVKIAAETYRTDTIKLGVGNKEAQAVKMVPARKHAFVSKRSGNYDVYVIDVDGKNEKKIVTGTGIERDDIALLQNKNGSILALVATRENTKNSDGYLLSTLYAVDTENGDLTKVDQSEQLQLLGWTDDGRLGYIKVAAGASAANPKRQRLMSFNSKDGAVTKELAATNYFNDAVMVGNKLYYAPSGDFQQDAKTGLFSINLDGTGLATIYDKTVWNIFRTAYDTFTINASGTWLTYKIGTSSTSVSAMASASTSRVYTDAPDAKTSLWIDQRDGKGVLLSFDKVSAVEKTLLSRSGLVNPLYWLSGTTIVFRINDGKETADYVMNVEGGEAKKICDVTNVKTVGQWYY